MSTKFVVFWACVLIAASVSSKPVTYDHNDFEDLNEDVQSRDAVYLKVLGLSDVRTKRHILTGGDNCPSDTIWELNACVSTTEEYR